MSKLMQNSGEIWCSDIPLDWNIEKIKYAAPIHTERAVSKAGYVALENIEGWTGRLFGPYTEPSGECVAYKKDDVLFGKLRPYLAKSFRAENNGCGSTELVVMRPCHIRSDYLEYITHCSTFVNRIDVSTYGAKMPRANAEFIGNLLIPLPPLLEQSAIVSFLDSRCAKIDEAISRHKQIIEKLEEYKKSVITQAVTKGLDPNVEMKDSCSDFIGLIPVHWTVTKIKYLLIDGDDGIKIGPFGSAIKGKTLPEGPVQIYNQANVIANDFDITRHFISANSFEELKSYEIKAGDILFSMMGTIGKCCIMPENKPIGIMDSHLLKARLNEKMLPEFFVYAYDKDLNNGTLQQLLFMSQGSIMNGLNSSIIKKIILPLPDINEQRAIVEFLNNKVEKIGKTINRHLSIIEKLEEYRKSIIYNAVTGKIDCRGTI